MARFWNTATAQRLRGKWQQWSDWIRDNVPPGARTILGLLLIVGGIFGILPVLGFWMIPLGMAVVAMDIRPIVRAFARKQARWTSNPRAEHGSPPPEDRSESEKSRSDE